MWPFSRRETRSVENPLRPLTDDSLIDIMSPWPPSETGLTPSPLGSLALSAVWRCVSLTAGLVGSMPLKAYRRAADGSRTPASLGWLEEPHPDLEAGELWELIVTHILLDGNAYLAVERLGSGRPLYGHLLAPGRVVPERIAATGEKRYRVDGSVLTESEILHFPGFGYDGIRGLSPVGVVREAVTVGLAGDKAAARLYGSGMLESGFLTANVSLTDEQATSIKRRWRDRSTAGWAGSGDVPILDGGLQFVSRTMSAEDAEFLASRNFQVLEVARLYGVPPVLMMTDIGAVWGTGVEEAVGAYLTLSVRTLLRRIERRLSATLPRPVFVEFLMDEVLRGVTVKRFEAYELALRNRWMSRNEVRRLENLEPIPGGDEMDTFPATGADSGPPAGPEGGEDG